MMVFVLLETAWFSFANVSTASLGTLITRVLDNMGENFIVKGFLKKSHII